MLRVAAALADITPVATCSLAGFSGRPDPFASVSSALEANAVAFRDENDRCAIVLTLDTLFVGAALHSKLTRHFVEAHHQNADDLMVLASHTHFAPALDHSKPTLGLVDPNYAAFVAGTCCELIDRVMNGNFAPARVEARTGTSHAAINRRRKWPLPHLYGRNPVGPQCVMAPNPAGMRDPSVTAFSIVGLSGEPLALVWHFACHPTGYPRQLEVSAEFPGAVRSRLRVRRGATLPVLFLQGFAGDIRPDVPETRPMARRMVNCLMSGPSFDTFTPKAWNDWAASLAGDVAATFESGPPRARVPADTVPPIASASSEIALDRLLTGEQGGRRVRLQRLCLDSTIDIVAVGAEPLTALHALVPIQGALATGYLGDVFGYWPSDRDARDGGYEVHHYLTPFGLHGRLRPSLDGVFRDAVGRLRQVQ